MTQNLWRIATEAPAYSAADLTGEGAEDTGGRWNERGVPAVYASETRALACLETVVHLNAGGLPLNRYLVAIKIPVSVWRKAQRETPASLPGGWDAEPAGKASIDFGTQWLKSKGTALMIIPSVIIPEEMNVLINPLHPDSSGISAAITRKWLYDPRLGQ